VGSAVIAGSGASGCRDGKRLDASLSFPSGVCYDGSRNALLIADKGNHQIRELSLMTGEVKTIAGSGKKGFEDGPMGTASFHCPVALAVSSNGSIFVADNENEAIRMIAGGEVTTIGSRTKGLKDGPAAEACFDNPVSLIVDPNDNVLVADQGNHRIRKIEFTADGPVVSTLIGRGPRINIMKPHSLAVTSDKAHFVIGDSGVIQMHKVSFDAKIVVPFKKFKETMPDVKEAVCTCAGPDDSIILCTKKHPHVLYRVSEEGAVATPIDLPENCDMFTRPNGMVMNPNNGKLFIADTFGHSIKQINLFQKKAPGGSTFGSTYGFSKDQKDVAAWLKEMKAQDDAKKQNMLMDFGLANKSKGQRKPSVVQLQPSAGGFSNSGNSFAQSGKKPTGTPKLGLSALRAAGTPKQGVQALDQSSGPSGGDVSIASKSGTAPPASTAATAAAATASTATAFSTTAADTAGGVESSGGDSDSSGRTDERTDEGAMRSWLTSVRPEGSDAAATGADLSCYAETFVEEGFDSLVALSQLSEQVSGLQVQQLIQVHTTTDCLSATFCTWIQTTMVIYPLGPNRQHMRDLKIKMGHRALLSSALVELGTSLGGTSNASTIGGEAEDKIGGSGSAPAHWTKGENIGAGAFGQVFLALNQETGEFMAVKELTLGPSQGSTGVIGGSVVSGERGMGSSTFMLGDTMGASVMSLVPTAALKKGDGGGSISNSAAMLEQLESEINVMRNLQVTPTTSPLLPSLTYPH
jgi:sugar lactone lactonase YvrE